MDPPAIEVEVEGEAASLSGAPVVVAVDERLPPGADVGDALASVPGAVVRRLGGLGAYTQVSLRGSTSRQVEVQLDGIPLDPDGASVSNLADLPLWALQEIRVWRSNPPVGAGPGGVGGVVDLVTGDPRGLSAAVAVGSYGAGTGHALAATPMRGGDVLAAVDVLSLEGNFRYLSDGGTPFTTIDDRLPVRENADKRQVSALVRVRGGEAVTWTVLDAFLAREEGIPGFTFATADAVRYGAVRNLAALEVASSPLSSRLTARGWTVARVEQLTDPLGEIGVGTGGSSSSLASGGVRGTIEVATMPALATSAVLEGRFDAFDDRTRQVGRAAFAADAWAGEVHVTPAVWLIAIADRSAEDVTLASYALPRLGATWRPEGMASVTATVGRTVRPPDPDELFGDRGAFVGNPALRPEDAWQADAGVHFVTDALSADLGAFWREVVDLIAFVQNAQQVAKPVNLDRASVRGVDAGLSASTSGVSGTVATTLLDAVNRSDDPAYAGNALPRLPLFEVEIAASAIRGPVQLGYAGSFTAGNWLDAANYSLAPPRVLHTAFTRVSLGEGWRLTGEVRNLTDAIAAASPRDPLVDDGAVAVRAVTDFTGYPLPGRAILVGVAWSAP